MHITCPILAKEPGIAHGFFTRRGGKSLGIYASLNCGYGSGDDIDIVTKNRAIVAESLAQEPGSLCTVYQVHSPNVITIDKAWHWEDAPEGDAMATNKPGIALGILSADCLPVLFADAGNRVIGAAHAGWKGALGGVIESTLDAMVKLGADRRQIKATIGPGIAQKSYEVGPEFREHFLKDHADNAACFIASPRPSRFLFDLKAYAHSRLEKAGIAHINLLAHDTCFEENDFFSFRRSTLKSEPAYGRQISVIALEE